MSATDMLAGVTPRTTATARVREVWDSRLRVSERELLLSLAGIDEESEPNGAGLCRWSDFTPDQASRLLLALRDLVTLGNEAAYALGYSRRNG